MDDHTSKNYICRPCSIKKENVKRRGPRCAICTLLPEQKDIRSSSTKTVHQLKSTSDCDSKFVIYALTCTKCNIQYVGRAENFRLRVNNHKSCINNRKTNDRGCTALYEHFAQTDHSLDQVQFTILQVCKNAPDMNRAEIRWIWTLKTIQPSGFNMDNGFNSQLSKPRK